MKRIVLLIAMAVSFTSYAQITVGVKAGLNFAHQSIDNSGLQQLPGSLTSLHGGFYAFKRLGQKTGIQSELLYSGMGSIYNYPGMTGSINLNYFSIPMLFCYSIGYRMTLHAGPQLGILTTARQTINGQSRDIRDDVKATDFGIAAGFSYDLPRGYHAGIRYVAGLKDINNGIMSNSGTSTTNGVLQVFIGGKLFER